MTDKNQVLEFLKDPANLQWAQQQMQTQKGFPKLEIENISDLEELKSAFTKYQREMEEYQAARESELKKEISQTSQQSEAARLREKVAALRKTDKFFNSVMEKPDSEEHKDAYRRINLFMEQGETLEDAIKYTKQVLGVKEQATPEDKPPPVSPPATSLESDHETPTSPVNMKAEDAAKKNLDALIAEHGDGFLLGDES